MADNNSKNPYATSDDQDNDALLKSTKDELTALQDTIEDKVDEILKKEGASSNELSEEEMQEAMEQVFKMIMEQVQQLDNEQDLTQVLGNLLKKKFIRLSP